MLNQVILVGSVTALPRLIGMTHETSELRFDLSTGKEIHHCKMRGELGLLGYDESMGIGDLIYTRGRLESRPVFDDEMVQPYDHVFIVIEEYQILARMPETTPESRSTS